MKNAGPSIIGLEKGQGYTTGSCAQAAAKASAIMLLTQKQVDKITIELPSGKRLTLDIFDQKIDMNAARCAVVKDSGDDPDVTDGIKIYAEVRFSCKKGITLTGAEGVGRVTKPGLAVEVGEYAINPVPRKMIRQEIEGLLADNKLFTPLESPAIYGGDKRYESLIPYRKGGVKALYFLTGFTHEKGLEVIISAPQGREIAKHTFNSRIGILDGISILGTTGIVEPKSLEAYKASLSLQLDVIKASGTTRVALVLGYVGEKYCKEALGLVDDCIVKIGDHVGFMLQECARKGINKVLLAGHIGKLVKVANGQFNTHCQHGDGRVDTIMHYARLCNASQDVIEELSEQNTAEAAVEILKKNNLTAIFDMLATAVVEKLNELVKSSLKINCYILSLRGEVLGNHLNFRENE